MTRGMLSPEVRLAEPADLGQVSKFLIPLGGESFGERFPNGTAQDFYRWKYLENPLGNSIVGIATAGRAVVSVVAATAKRIWLHGKTVVAYEIGDLLTDNAYRGMGLFSQLIELVCSEARDHGSCLVYARPNRIALPILAGKLHFQEAQRIDTRRWVIPSRVLSRETGIPASLLRLSGMDWLLKSRIPRWSGDVVTAVPVDRFAEEVDQLWRRASEGFDFALVRDSNYLNWRFCDCPTPYKIWCALRKGKTVGFLVTSADRATPTAAIIDLFTDSGDVEAVRVLLANGMDFMLSNGVQSVRSWTLQGPVQSAAHKLLQRMLPFRRKQSHALVFRVLLPQEITLPVSSKKWHFNLGDTDGA